MMDVMPLHLAIAWAQTDAAIWLLKHGANPMPDVKIRQQVLGLDFASDTLSVLVFASMFIEEPRFYQELYWRLRKPAFLLRYGTIGKYREERDGGKWCIPCSVSTNSSASTWQNDEASSSSMRISPRRSVSPRRSSSNYRNRNKLFTDKKECNVFANRFRDIPPELFQQIVNFL